MPAPDAAFVLEDVIVCCESPAASEVAREIIRELDAAGFAIVPKELPTSAFSADALANGVAEQYRTLVNFVRTIP